MIRNANVNFIEKKFLTQTWARACVLNACEHYCRSQSLTS